MENDMSRAADYFKELLAKERPFREAQAKDVLSREIVGAYFSRQATQPSPRPSIREALKMHDCALALHRKHASRLRHETPNWHDTYLARFARPKTATNLPPGQAGPLN
jgi:hypothetical protein